MTDDDIQKILHRAAELQGLRTPDPAEDRLGAPDDRQRLGSVAEAAEEAGISKADFALAAAELTGSPGQKPTPPRTAARARRWLGHPERVFELRTALPGHPDAVLAALQTVLAGGDFQVDITNVVGDDPLVDGVLVLEPADLLQLSMGRVTPFRYAMATADFRQVLVTLRADTEAEGRTILTLHAALDHSAVMSYRWALGTSAVVAAGMGLAALGLAGSGGLVAAVVAGGLGFGVAWALMRWAWKAMYRWGINKGKTALASLADRVGRSLRLKGL